MWKKNSIWDKNKEQIFSEKHLDYFNFDFDLICIGEKLNAEWWELKTNEKGIVGYGWIHNSDNKNEVEISIFVLEKYRSKGFGSKIIHKLEEEIKNKGINKITALVLKSHPYPKDIFKFLLNKGYKFSIYNENININDKEIDNVIGLLRNHDILTIELYKYISS